MKRLGKGTYQEICSKENLYRAHENAKRGKTKYKQVRQFEADLERCMLLIQDSLLTKTFSTSKYVIKKKVEGGKLREIYSLPYFPDRVVQHALLQVIGPRLEKSFIRDTFQSIKGRGTSDARKRVSRFIKINRPTHYLQLDISKYYPSINNSKLKQKIRSVIKCPDTLHLLDNIISSCEGLPIGNYTSQVLGNYYLTDFDWFIKQQLKVKGYFRYCDDLVFFGTSSKELMDIKILVEKYLQEEGLTLKHSWKLSHLNTGCDFVGYQFYPNGIKLRKRIYKSAKAALVKGSKGIPAYFGWVLPLTDSDIKRRYTNAIRNRQT